MAMSPAIRNELGKSRELLWFLLYGKRCFFCKKLFITKIPNYVKFGNCTAPAVLNDVEITEHHRNGNHSDNRPSNLVLAHTSCHKSHHAVLVFKKWRKQMAGATVRNRRIA